MAAVVLVVPWSVCHRGVGASGVGMSAVPSLYATLCIRVPVHLHTHLVRLAKASGTSPEQYAVEAIDCWVVEHRAKGYVAPEADKTWGEVPEEGCRV